MGLVQSDTSLMHFSRPALLLSSFIRQSRNHKWTVSLMDGSDVSEGQLVLKSGLVSGLGRVEGENTILGKKKPLEQIGKRAFDTDQ